MSEEEEEEEMDDLDGLSDGEEDATLQAPDEVGYFV